MVRKGIIMQERILDKIKKLQALAGNNPSESEAQAAAAKVQALLFAHNLEMRDVEGHTLAGSEEPYEKTEQCLNANSLTMKWKSILYHGVGKHNFVQTVRHPGTTKLSMIGKRSNIEAVCYLAEYLIAEIERLATIECRHVLTQKAIYKREFCYGAASRILARLREEREQAARSTVSSTALVVVSDKELQQAVAVHFPSLCSSYSRSSNRTGGYEAGRQAGAGIGLPRAGIGVSGQRQLA